MRENISLVALPHLAHSSAPFGIDSPQLRQRRAIRRSFQLVVQTPNLRRCHRLRICLANKSGKD